MSLEEILQDPVALKAYVDRELNRIIIRNWLRDREEAMLGVALYGGKGLPSPVEFLPEGWHEAYYRMIWKRLQG